MTSIPNVLAERYATPPMKSLWSQEGKIALEREFWVALMKAQRALGLEVPEEAIAAYEKVLGEIDLESIQRRERITRHDVKARIDEFCELAGHQQIHKGMTSRDLTENVEQLQVFRALVEVRLKAAAVLAALAARAHEFRDLPLTARTHNVAAQTTTLGKRLAMFGAELLGAWGNLDALIKSYPVRGLKGAVGTQLDQLSLFEGDQEKVTRLEDALLEHLGIPESCATVGQVYPRSLDLRVVAALCEIGAGPSSFATTLRLMAGHELASEGFAEGQTGSSAMPHKVNSRSSERINGFQVLLRGYLSMASSLAGDQWNEGDVSCSVVRRVVLPDAFFAVDGMLETTLTVLRQMRVYEGVIRSEHQRYLPFLLSTTFLMEALKNGVGRETAHQAIKEHAVAAASAMRNGEPIDILDAIAADERLGLKRDTLDKLLEEGASRIGAAAQQVDAFCEQVDRVLERFPEARDYLPGAIL